MIWSRAYRHTIADLVAALSICEANVLEAVHQEHVFYKFGRLLLHEDFLSSALEADLCKRTAALVHLMTGTSPLYWQATRLLAKRIPVRSAATAIMLKNNVRAIYPQIGLTLKVSNPNDASSADRIVNEASNRKIIRDAGGITVPRIIKSSRVEDFACILETLLEKHRAIAARDINKNFVSGFVKFQIANRIDIKSLKDDFRPEVEFEKFRILASSYQISIPPKLIEFLKTAAEQTATAPFTLCHGDLSRSNILFSNDKLAFVDWEFSKAAPAPADAVRLATQFPGFADAYVKELRHPDAMMWFVLGCINAANAHQERLHGLADNRHRQTAGRKTSRKFAEIIALADSHAILKP